MQPELEGSCYGPQHRAAVLAEARATILDEPFHLRAGVHQSLGATGPRSSGSSTTSRPTLSVDPAMRKVTLSSKGGTVHGACGRPKRARQESRPRTASTAGATGRCLRSIRALQGAPESEYSATKGASPRSAAPRQLAECRGERCLLMRLAKWPTAFAKLYESWKTAISPRLGTGGIERGRPRRRCNEPLLEEDQGEPFSRGLVLPVECHYGVVASVMRSAARYPGANRTLLTTRQLGPTRTRFNQIRARFDAAHWPGNVRELANVLARPICRGTLHHVDTCRNPSPHGENIH